MGKEEDRTCIIPDCLISCTPEERLR